MGCAKEVRCTEESHNDDKASVAALTDHYIAHDEFWELAGKALLMFTCRRCGSTIHLPALLP